MSLLLACDYEGCEKTRCIATPQGREDFNDGWLTMGVNGHVHDNAFNLCPEHAALLSREQWKLRLVNDG